MAFLIGTVFLLLRDGLLLLSRFFEVIGLVLVKWGVTCSWEFAVIISLLILFRSKGWILVVLSLGIIFAWESDSQELRFGILQQIAEAFAAAVSSGGSDDFENWKKVITG